MKQKLGIALIGFATLALAMPAEAQLLTIIHGAPSKDRKINSNMPIDIAFNGTCEFTYKTYGAKMGPENILSGQHTIDIFEHKPNKDCQGNLLASWTFFLYDQQEVDVVFHHDSKTSKGFTFSIFDNKPSLQAIAGSKNAAVEIRHVAAAGEITASLSDSQGLAEEDILRVGDIIGPLVTAKGIHQVSISRGARFLDDAKGNLKQERAYWVYITGSVLSNSMELLVYESIPLGDIDPPGDMGIGSNQNCCFSGVCAPNVNFTNCGLAGGIFVGSAPCIPNPCG